MNRETLIRAIAASAGVQHNNRLSDEKINQTVLVIRAFLQNVPEDMTVRQIKNVWDE